MTNDRLKNEYTDALKSQKNRSVIKAKEYKY